MELALGSAEFWVALGKIIWINILLSGDNAVVVALAARGLAPKQQKQAILWGTGAAIVMRIVLTLVAVQLLQFPYLKIIGAVLLLYIGVTLLLPEEEHDADGEGNSSMAVAIRTILIADLVMSLDNVIAVAAAAQGSLLLLIIGLATSIPIVIFGSTLLIKVIERFPIIVWAGAGLLGYIAGEITVEDPAIKDRVAELAQSWGTTTHGLAVGLGVLGAIFVIVLGKILLSRRSRRELQTNTGHG